MENQVVNFLIEFLPQVLVLVLAFFLYRYISTTDSRVEQIIASAIGQKNLDDIALKLVSTAYYTVLEGRELGLESLHLSSGATRKQIAMTLAKKSHMFRGALQMFGEEEIDRAIEKAYHSLVEVAVENSDLLLDEVKEEL